ncbi:DNA repair protein RadC [archaeon]|jgi:DNA repair protein RadC|nr:DNA repair protein RadC [archaeon]MBT7128605.1 DNA repair protein RadC [archaeon]
MKEYTNNPGKRNETAIFWEDLKSGRFASMIKESSKGNALSNALEVCNIMKPFFARHEDVEKMYCIFLDAKNKIIAIEKMFSGSIRSSAVYPREIVKLVLEKKAAAVILTHNHPSGCETPSSEDFMITARITIALSSIEVALHDHLIIGENFYSFADQGWLAKAKQRYDEFISSSKHIM